MRGREMDTYSYFFRYRVIFFFLLRNLLKNELYESINLIFDQSSI